MAQVRLFHGKPLMISGKVALSDDCCCGGACCKGTWPALACSIESEAQCIADGGNFLGQNTTCDGVDCNSGACCQFSGSCTDEQEFLCISPAEFHGYGTVCSTTRCEGVCQIGDGCEQDPQDRCACYDDLTYAECQALIPSYSGSSFWLLSGDCITNPCPPVFPSGLGACCDEFCNCVDGVSEADCISFGGTFWLEDANCAPFGNACGCGYVACR